MGPPWGPMGPYGAPMGPHGVPWGPLGLSYGWTLSLFGLSTGYMVTQGNAKLNGLSMQPASAFAIVVVVAEKG